METATVNKQFDWGARNYTHILKRQIINDKHYFNYTFAFQVFQLIYLYGHLQKIQNYVHGGFLYTQSL